MLPSPKRGPRRRIGGEEAGERRSSSPSSATRTPPPGVPLLPATSFELYKYHVSPTQFDSFNDFVEDLHGLIVEAVFYLHVMPKYIVD